MLSVLSAAMGNMNACAVPAESESLPDVPPKLQLQRSCSAEVKAQLGLLKLYRSESEEKNDAALAAQSALPAVPAVAEGGWSVFWKKPKTKEAKLAAKQAKVKAKAEAQAKADKIAAEKAAIAASKAAATAQKAAEKSAAKAAKVAAKVVKAAAEKLAQAVAVPVPVFVDDRPRFGLKVLTAVPAERMAALAAMSLEQLVAELGILANVKSARVAAEEKAAADAARIKKAQEQAEQKLDEPAPEAAAAVAPASVKPTAPAMNAMAVAEMLAEIVHGDPNVVPAAPYLAPAQPNPSVEQFDEYGEPINNHSGKGKYWAAGTGYGHHGAEGSWDIDSYMASQAVTTESIQFVLRKVSDRLDEVMTTGKLPMTFAELADSCFLPVFEAYLANDSMAEIIEQHGGLYSDLFSCVAHVLAVGAPTVSPYAELLRAKAAPMLRNIAKSAAAIEKIEAQTAEKAMAAAGVAGSAACGSSGPSVAAPTLTGFVIELNSVLEAALALPKDGAVQPAEPEVVAAASAAPVSCSSPPAAASAAASVAAESDAAYVKALSEHRFSEVEEFVGHYYQSQHANNSKTAFSRAFTRRLAVEFNDLSSSLPVHPSSSVWMRVHESNMQYAQMMISGPEGTPYENGLFLFDVYFGPNYPAGPPQVNLMTTGRGSVRFNPNLYDCGKVCLSILGTWGGGVGEGWSSSSSTFLQVAISIQSLVFVPQPYFNEPSYEETMHTAEGQSQSEEYSKPLLLATLQHAMLDQMASPPKGFEEVVANHFALKKDAILAQAQKWAERNQAINSVMDKLKEALEKQKAC